MQVVCEFVRKMDRAWNESYSRVRGGWSCGFLFVERENLRKLSL